MPILFLIVFIDLVGFGLVIPLLPFYAERFAASPLQMTLLFAAYSLMSMLAAPLWGRLSDRVGRRPVLMASMAASALAYLLAGFRDAAVDGIPGARLRRRLRRQHRRGAGLYRRRDPAREARQGHGHDRRRLRARLYRRAGARRAGRRQ